MMLRRSPERLRAESDRLFRVAGARRIQRTFGHEDDRALRLCAAKLLADRYEAWRRLRVQRGDKSGPGRADPELTQKVYPRRSSLADGKQGVEFPLRQRQV